MLVGETDGESGQPMLLVVALLPQLFGDLWDASLFVEEENFARDAESSLPLYRTA